MNFEHFIANRGTKNFNRTAVSGTKPIIRIAVLSIALGLAVMIIAVAIVTGFQAEIRSKVIGFGSHIQISNLDLNTSAQTKPVNINQNFYPHLDTVSGIHHIQIYATKAGIIKTKEEVQGVLLKGVGTDFDWGFFKKNLKTGNPPVITEKDKSNDVVISSFISKRLKLEIGDKFKMYFVQDPIRQRQFKVCGIYETGLEQLDEAFILGDIKHIQKLNNWSPDQISGFDVTLERYEDLEKLDEFIYNYIGYDLNSEKITDRYMEIFGWLELLDMNVVVILIFATLVAAINMISALLVLILEKTNMIGILKALGSTNWSIRKIFLYNAGYLIGQGLLWGNLIAIIACIAQQKFNLIALPKESYYVDSVPINLELSHLVLLNIGTFCTCLLMLILPSYVVTKISPIKAIRFN